MLSGFSIGHLLIVLLVILLVFGTKKLRSAGGDLGSAIKQFKHAVNDDDQNQKSSETRHIQNQSNETTQHQQQHESSDNSQR